jgi:hypothetical protein
MIALSAAAVGAASGVGVDVSPAEQAVISRLIAKIVITNLYFIRVASAKFLLLSYAFP